VAIPVGAPPVVAGMDEFGGRSMNSNIIVVQGSLFLNLHEEQQADFLRESLVDITSAGGIPLNYFYISRPSSKRFSAPKVMENKQRLKLLEPFKSGKYNCILVTDMLDDEPDASYITVQREEKYTNISTALTIVVYFDRLQLPQLLSYLRVLTTHYPVEFGSVILGDEDYTSALSTLEAIRKTQTYVIMFTLFEDISH
jgi:hypothetical protein